MSDYKKEAMFVLGFNEGKAEADNRLKEKISKLEAEIERLKDIVCANIKPCADCPLESEGE